MARSNSNALSALMAVAILLQSVQCQLPIDDQNALKEILFSDTSNDDAVRMSAQDLLKRSGYDYEEHYVISDDGYITMLLRIINPLAKELRSPPIAIYHGANIDSSAYLMASSIQHHPEPYPRTADSGPFTSYNRSLGFTLANNGYDVWLVGVRGSNAYNQKWTNDPKIKEQIRNGDYSSINDESLFDYAKTSSYWLFGLDEEIQYEVKQQLDKVMSVTKSDELFLYSYSLSTPTTMAFLAANPDYARRIKVYFQQAPAIAATHFTPFDLLYFEKISPLTPTRGIGFFPSYTIQSVLREIIIAGSKSSTFRYSFVYGLYSALLGPSPLFKTYLEPNVLSRTFQPASYKKVQQYSQNSVTRNFTYFDYSSIGNKKFYGTKDPPAHDISRLEVQEWAIVYGTKDALADPDTIERLIAGTTSPNPVHRIIGEDYNHVDFVAAVDNDVVINRPILELLNQHSS